MSRKCTKCGYQGESKFCPECGGEMFDIVEEKTVDNPVPVDVEIETSEDAPIKKEKRRINLKILAVIASAIVIIAIAIYLMTPMNRATYSSEAEMKSHWLGVYEKVGVGEKYLVIDENTVDELFVFSTGDDTSFDWDIKEWNYKRGYIATTTQKIITKKDGTLKFGNDIYKWYDAEDSYEDDSKENKATEEETEKESASVGEKNALKSAEDYLSLSTGFSENRLRDQLEYEGYESSEIDYALDNCGADWREQCKKGAQSYLDTSMSFSKQGLIDQLVYEGFDVDMATEVVDEVYQ